MKTYVARRLLALIPVGLVVATVGAACRRAVHSRLRIGTRHDCQAERYERGEGETQMKAISLKLDDDVDAELEVLCAAEGRDKGDVVTEVVRKYVETARLRRALGDPALTRLYEELAGEDSALAEENIAEYRRLLKSADDA